MVPTRTTRIAAAAGFAAIVAASFMAATAFATFPGANGGIAFVTGGVIHTIRPDGTGDRRLVGSAADPSWSADGQHIAYTRFIGSQRTAIYTMRADGSNQRRLTDSRLNEGGPGYSPSGGRIVFTRATPQGRSVVVSVRAKTGTDEQVLTRGVGWADGYRPDGRRILYAALSSEAEAGAIWDMRPDGSDKRQLTFPNAHQADDLPDYSPDGKRIIFRRTGNNNHPFVMHADGSDVHRVGCGEVFSPDGRRVARTGYAGGDPGSADIFTSTLRCTDPFRVTHYADTASGGAWSPSWQPLPTG